MDSARTEKMLDDLADMFLTETVPAKPPPESSFRDDPSPIEDASEPYRELDGPHPIRLEPQSELSGGNETLLEDNSQNDASSVELSSAMGPTNEVEAVFLGNLPGISGPWLAQYAKHVAGDGDTAGILHMLGDDTVELELVSPNASEWVGRQRENRSLFEVLEQLQRTNGAHFQRWLVHLPPPYHEEDLNDALELDTWTILCGADDAAIVDAYRIVKQLVEASNARGESQIHRQVQVMLMGSDEAHSVAAARKLNSASASFLHSPVLLTGYQKQMVPVMVQSLGGFPTEGAASNPRQQIIRRLRELGPRKPERESEPTNLEQLLEEPGERSWANGDEDLADEPLVQETPVSAPSADTRDPTPTLEPEAPTPVDRDDSQDPELVGFLKDSGVLGLEARCPQFPQTELALDEHGCLHLLRRQNPEHDNVDSLVIELIAVREWIHHHLDLIQLTQRQCHFAPDRQPQIHLFVSDAKRGVDLVKKLGSLVRLHLLHQVVNRGVEIWCHASLQ